MKEKVNVEEHIPYYAKQPKFGKKEPSKFRQQFINGLPVFLIILGCVCAYFVLLRFEEISNLVDLIVDVLKPIIYGFSIAYLLNPIVKRVDKKLIPELNKRMEPEKAEKMSRTAGVTLSLVFLITLVVALCNMLIPELYKSIRDMISTLPGDIGNLLIRLREFEMQGDVVGTIVAKTLEEAAEALQTWVRTDLVSQVNTVVTNVTAGVFNIVGEVFNFLIGLMVSVYVLFAKERFSKHAKKLTYAFLKIDHANLVLHLTRKSNEIFGGFIIGKIIDSVIIGIICFIGLTILKMPYTLLVSVVIGVTNVIPFFGPFIGAIPCAILILLVNPLQGLYFVIFILLLQQLDGNVIGPKILGESTGVSAFGVIFSILIGGGLFGFPGMVLGVPTFALVYYVTMMAAESRLEKKKLPLHIDNYDEMSYVDEKGMYVASPALKEKKEADEE